MARAEHEFEISIGRRDGDGHVRVFVFAGSMLALTLEGGSERAPTLLLTIEQARSLQNALTELVPLLEEAEQRERQAAGQPWQGTERRASGELNR